MENIQNLLNQVAIISKKNAEILDASGGRFDIFEVCGVNRYENIHSSILVEFLNPKGSHGLKSKFLQCFLELLKDKLTVCNFEIETARVITEYSNAEGRIDILIEDNRNHALIIENKIDAKDQPEQLIRYDRFAQKYGKGNYDILYLTLDGTEASSQSSENVNYQSISYRKDIIEWLEKCVEIAVRHPMVRETINQFINHLKKITNQDMDTKNQSEIIELLMQSNNLRSAQVIYQNYENVFNVLAEKYFCPKMEKFAEKKKLNFKYEKSGEDYIDFDFTKPEWNKKIWLSFKKDSSGYYYGLCDGVDDPSNRKNNLKILANRLENKDFKSGRWCVCYKHFNHNLDNWINDIIHSNRFYKDCVEKISELLDALKDLKF